ncbi:MAG: hypothetical protein WAW85_10140 [Gordonia sp. (in: high G+C Gram-positive bacteria)]|uniref:hypothetical protein n=1 Tax=Gordonia sp. (in: high G+C Gram-positive bacteria) TaxID=84139 RepID=UPI003BB7EBE3
MSGPPEGFTPDPSTCPTLVRWAYRLWLTSGSLLAVVGVVSIVLAVLEVGWNLGLLAVAILVTAVGLAYLPMARKAMRHHQGRGVLASLTVVVLVMVLVLTIGFQSGELALVLFIAVIGFAGSVLAYRPAADAWYNGTDAAPAAATTSSASES